MIINSSKTVDEHFILISKLYEQYVDHLYRYGLSMRISSSSCMDAIHDVFYILYMKNEKIEQIKNFKTYIFQSFKHQLINIKKRENKSDLHQNIESIPFEVEVSALDNIINKEEQKFIIDKVRSLLNMLTNRQREAIYLRYMQNLSYDEIAVILDMNPASVRKLIYRSIDKIRKEVKKLNTSTPLIISLDILLFFGQIVKRHL